MARLVGRLRCELRLLASAVDTLVWSVWPKGPPPLPLAAAAAHPATTQHSTTDHPLATEDSILWAVPKNRRSRERRLTRKFGLENKHKKMLPYRTLLTCDDCGHMHEPGRLCPNCYGENKKITQAMQEAMVSMQGLSPVEHETLPVFKGEKVNTKDGFHEGKRIFEVPTERPKWFSNRLTIKSNVTTSSDTTVAKPTNLA